MAVFLTKREMALEIGVHPDMLKEYRRRLVENVHYVKPNSRVVRYHRDLVLHWFANQNSPETHQKAIESYLASLPENQPRKRGRKATAA